MRREAHPRVQGPGARVVGLHLEPGRRGALGQRPAGQGRHDRGGETLAAQGRVDLHRRETGPASVDHTAADRRGYARFGARHGREPHRGPAAQHLQGHFAHALALVAAEPGLVRLARQRDGPVGAGVREITDRGQSADPHLRGHLAHPPPRLQLRAQQLLRARRPGRGLHVRGQLPGRVPLPYERQRVVQRDARVADRQHRIGPPGEPRGGPQLPLAELLPLDRLPGPGGDPRQLLVRGGGALPPSGRGGYDLARHQRRFRNTDALPGPSCDQQHTVVP